MTTTGVIGIGAGDPAYATVQAVNALNRVDVFYFVNKGNDRDDLLGVHRMFCERDVCRPRYRIVEATDPERRCVGRPCA